MTSAAAKMVKNVPVPPARPRTGSPSRDDEILNSLAGPASSKTTTAEAKAHRRRWTSSGPRTATPANCSSSRPGPRPCSRARTRMSWRTYQTRSNAAGCSSPAAASARRSRPGRCASSRARSTSTSFKQGEVLVTDKTDPDWEPIMKKAAAIVTNRGGRTCHAAIVSRELGVPAIVGTEHGTEVLKDGQIVTVSCAEGDTGFVYEGRLPFEVRAHEPERPAAPRTKVMMNVANPEEAFSLSLHPQRRRRPRARGIHHHHLHQDPSARAARLRQARRRRSESDRSTS